MSIDLTFATRARSLSAPESLSALTSLRRLPEEETLPKDQVKTAVQGSESRSPAPDPAPLLRRFTPAKPVLQEALQLNASLKSRLEPFRDPSRFGAPVPPQPHFSGRVSPPSVDDTAPGKSANVKVAEPVSPSLTSLPSATPESVPGLAGARNPDPARASTVGESGFVERTPLRTIETPAALASADVFIESRPNVGSEEIQAPRTPSGVDRADRELAIPAEGSARVETVKPAFLPKTPDVVPGTPVEIRTVPMAEPAFSGKSPVEPSAPAEDLVVSQAPSETRRIEQGVRTIEERVPPAVVPPPPRAPEVPLPPARIDEPVSVKPVQPPEGIVSSDVTGPPPRRGAREVPPTALRESFSAPVTETPDKPGRQAVKRDEREVLPPVFSKTDTPMEAREEPRTRPAATGIVPREQPPVEVVSRGGETRPGPLLPADVETVGSKTDEPEGLRPRRTAYGELNNRIPDPKDFPTLDYQPLPVAVPYTLRTEPPIQLGPEAPPAKVAVERAPRVTPMTAPPPVGVVEDRDELGSRYPYGQGVMILGDSDRLYRTFEKFTAQIGKERIRLLEEFPITPTVVPLPAPSFTALPEATRPRVEGLETVAGTQISRDNTGKVDVLPERPKEKPYENEEISRVLTVQREVERLPEETYQVVPERPAERLAATAQRVRAAVTPPVTLLDFVL